MAELIRVTELAQLTDTQPFCLEHRGVPYVVVKTKKGIKAYVSLCAHKDLAMFPPKFKKGCLVCPYHKVSFAATSGKVEDDQGKDVPHGLPPVRVLVENDVLFLQARKKHRRVVPKGQRKRIKRLGQKRNAATK